MESIYRESLLELELIHKQEELEQLNLEQALAMSLIAEEERIKQARLEFKNAPDDDEEEEEEHQQQAEAKQSSSLNMTTTETSKFSEGSKDSDSDRKQQVPSKIKLKPSSNAGDQHTYADPKPLKMSGFGSPMKALPSISKAKKQENLTEMNRSFNEKKKKAEQAFTKNSRQLSDSRSRHVSVLVHCVLCCIVCLHRGRL